MGKKRCKDELLAPSKGGGDLIKKILVWLPVLSLLRFKSVCKSWRDLIQTSSFIDLHTANTFNSSSSSSSNKFGSFILLAAIERHVWIPKGIVAPKHLKEYALLMLSSSSSSSSTEESVSSTGCWWWSSAVSSYMIDAVKEEAYDDQVFTVDYYYYCNTNLLRGGSTSNDDDDHQQQLVCKLESLGFPPCFKFRDNFSFTNIVGSWNGLVCLYDRYESKDVSLWNPATRQFRVLPKSITIDDDNCQDDLVAFGFDVQTKDYKVLLVTCFNPRHYRLAAPVECLCRVQVYSSSTNSWRLLEGIDGLPGYPEYSATEGYIPYLNGSCFFIAKFFFSKRQKCFPENNRFIISFDFTKEIFTPIQLPDHHHDQDLYLSSLGDKLAIFKGAYYAKDADDNDIWIRNLDDKFHPGISQIFDIWVLNNEHSICSVNRGSWTKLYSFRIEHERPGESIIPRGISNDGEFAIIETKFSNEVGKKMKLYNLVTKEVKKNFLACSMVMSIANAYKPSLVDFSTW